MKVLHKVTDKIRWWRAGSPTDEPVVREVGDIFVCPHGRYALSGWIFQPGHMQQQTHMDDLVDRLTARYPTTRRTLPHQCSDCAREETL